MTERDARLLAAIGRGNQSAGLRRIMADWRLNRDTVYQMQEDQMLVKQVTVYHRLTEGGTVRHFVEVFTIGDSTEEAFDTLPEALAYAQSVMVRDLRPMHIDTLLDRR